MKLPKNFDTQSITIKNLKLLKQARDNDEELCMEPAVWRTLCDEEDMPKTMGSVIAWIG